MLVLLLEQQQSQSSSDQDDTSDSTEKRNKWLAFGVAALAMTLYALATGLVQVEITRTEDFDDSESSTPDMSAFMSRDQENSEENTSGWIGFTFHQAVDYIHCSTAVTEITMAVELKKLRGHVGRCSCQMIIALDSWSRGTG